MINEVYMDQKEEKDVESNLGDSLAVRQVAKYIINSWDPANQKAKASNINPLQTTGGFWHGLNWTGRNGSLVRKQTSLSINTGGMSSVNYTKGTLSKHNSCHI